jgi:hypothetical protein
LVADNPSVSNMQRVIRLSLDARVLDCMHVSEIKPLYDKIEAARDVLSRILDRADGKDA